MAKNDKLKINQNVVNRLKDSIQLSMDRLFASTYRSSPLLQKDINDVRDSLDKSLDAIVKLNHAKPNVNINSLYQRLNLYKNKDNDKNIGNDLEGLFNDKELAKQLVPSLIQNKLLRQYDEDIDTLCKFVPSLEEALEVKRDHVLASDSYSKEFINIINKSITDKNELSKFNSLVESVKKRYNLNKLYKDSYYKAAKYGEEYIYITSYNKAFAKLMNNRSNGTYIQESYIGLYEYANSVGFKSGYVNKRDLQNENNQIKVKFYSGIIPSAIQEQTKINNVLEATTKNDFKFDTIVDNHEPDFEGPEEYSQDKSDAKYSADGFVNTKYKETDFKVNGAIVKRLKRECVLPIYTNDICMGYYYIDCKANKMDQYFDKGSMGFRNTLGFMSSNGGSMFDYLKNDNEDDALKFLSNQLSEKIDKQFINNNQDLKQEIYLILKNNDIFHSSDVELDISYISPNEMVAMMFKEDEESHRGISDLDKSMVNGKLYASLMTTNTLGIITRGFDKRVYYVKQQVDTNISQILLNTVNQIKKSNFGTRELTNLKNTLNITGRYNDLLIPVGPSGDYPVQFEIMPGQDIDPKQELCERLEEQAINATGVPYEYVQSESQVDFATRLTMSNVKFLRIILARQEQTEKFFTQILLKILETEEVDVNQDIFVKLNPPTYLNLVNNSEIVRGMTDYAQSLVDIFVDGDDDKLKNITKRNIIKTYLSGQIDIAKLQSIIEDSAMEYKSDNNPEE